MFFNFHCILLPQSPLPPTLGMTTPTHMQARKTVKGENSTYKIEDQCLGSGHFAEVFGARDLATKQTRACKIINLVNRSFNQEERDAIDTEIDILRQVHHVSWASTRFPFHSLHVWAR